MDWRRKIYEEIQKLPNYSQQPHYAIQPETKDFEKVKNIILAKLAFRIWENTEKPLNRDVDIWMQAESVWNFIRYAWEEAI